MKHSTIGRPRKYSDEIVRAVKQWRTMDQMCTQLGIERSTFMRLRRVEHKKADPNE